jgi:heme oxygenase (biliverdin-IX-beta and delta-forming)
MSALFARLKSGTEQQHREIEALIDPTRTFASMEAYKIHLLNTWSVYASLEPELDMLDWCGLGFDLASRRKTPLLEQDLRILGVPLPMPERIPQPRVRIDVSFALGCLYVVEGATLGGQVISRLLATIGIGAENGGLFFNGYGVRTGEMWKSFQLQAAGHCVTDDQIEAAVQGARWTFGRFRDSMVQGRVPSDAS